MLHLLGCFVRVCVCARAPPHPVCARASFSP